MPKSNIPEKPPLRANTFSGKAAPITEKEPGTTLGPANPLRDRLLMELAVELKLPARNWNLQLETRTSKLFS